MRAVVPIIRSARRIAQIPRRAPRPQAVVRRQHRRPRRPVRARLQREDARPGRRAAPRGTLREADDRVRRDAERDGDPRRRARRPARHGGGRQEVVVEGVGEEEARPARKRPARTVRLVPHQHVIGHMRLVPGQVGRRRARRRRLDGTRRRGRPVCGIRYGTEETQGGEVEMGPRNLLRRPPPPFVRAANPGEPPRPRRHMDVPREGVRLVDDECPLARLLDRPAPREVRVDEPARHAGEVQPRAARRHGEPPAVHAPERAAVVAQRPDRQRRAVHHNRAVRPHLQRGDRRRVRDVQRPRHHGVRAGDLRRAHVNRVPRLLNPQPPAGARREDAVLRRSEPQDGQHRLRRIRDEAVAHPVPHAVHRVRAAPDVQGKRIRLRLLHHVEDDVARPVPHGQEVVARHPNVFLQTEVARVSPHDMRRIQDEPVPRTAPLHVHARRHKIADPHRPYGPVPGAELAGGMSGIVN